MDMTPLEFFSQERFQGFKPGFARTQALLDALGNPEKQLRFVHVAGTNGKGSVCACLASILTKAGYKTGLYTSPYVVTWNERIQVCGEYISEEDLEEAVRVVAPIAEAMEDAPTQFEVETALAIWYFAHVRCDIAVLEVGMGGEWDATNVIPAPEAAVICAIGLDHTGVLGSTPGEIAAVKAGIIKPGSAVASYGSGDEAEAVIEARCAEKGCPLVRPDLSRLGNLRPGLEGCRFDYGAYKDLFVPLAGTYQPRNAALAITAAELLRTRGWSIAEEHIREGLASVRWPGRFEVLRREPIFILDGSHNPHGMAATAESLRTYFRGEKLWFVIGVMADKDVAGIARLLVPMAAGFAAVEPPNPRAMKPVSLADLLRRETGAEAVPFTTIEAGVNWVLTRAAHTGRAAAALGSLYFSGQVRAAVEKWGKAETTP